MEVKQMIIQRKQKVVNRMKKRIIFLLTFCFLLLLYSCESSMKEYLARSWIVNSIEIDGVNYGKSIMRLNLLTLEGDSLGRIPSVTYLDTIPTNEGKYKDLNWKLLDSIDDEYYIEIYNTKVDYFNDTFKVNIIDKNKFLVRFESKRVKLDCQGFSEIGIAR